VRESSDARKQSKTVEGHRNAKRFVCGCTVSLFGAHQPGDTRSSLEIRSLGRCYLVASERSLYISFAYMQGAPHYLSLASQDDVVAEQPSVMTVVRGALSQDAGWFRYVGWSGICY
jgi:hypothetical protein